jgi:hypothetical protein
MGLIYAFAIASLASLAYSSYLLWRTLDHIYYAVSRVFG